MIRRLLAICCLTLSSTFAVLAASSPWDHVPRKDHAHVSPLARNPDAANAGAIIYRHHCQQCHLANGAGDGHKRPSLRSDRIRMATDGDIEWFLRQGDLTHGMPSWSGLPEMQRWQIVAYLRSIQ